MVSKKELATLNVAVKMETSQFRREAAKLKGDVKKTGKSVRSASGGAGGSMFFGRMTTATVAIGATTIALSKMKREVDEVARLTKEGRIYGVKPREWIALADLADNAAVKITDLGQAFRRVDRQVEAAVRGSKEAIDVFKQLGLDPGDLAGMDAIKRNDLIIEQLAKIEDRTIRVGRATKLADIGGGMALLKLAEDYGTLADDIERVATVSNEAAYEMEKSSGEIAKASARLSGFYRSYILGPTASAFNKAFGSSKIDQSRSIGGPLGAMWRGVFDSGMRNPGTGGLFPVHHGPVSRSPHVRELNRQRLLNAQGAPQPPGYSENANMMMAMAQKVVFASMGIEKNTAQGPPTTVPGID